MKNRMELTFLSVSENEAFARSTVAAFIAQLNPTMDEVTEIKTVVSEAVTNAIIHGYNHQADSEITIVCEIFANKEVELIITDQGTGIENIYEAKEPLYTSKPELERSGMGFSIMDSFMDSLEIYSTIDKGTTLIMRKQLTKTETACH
ncbi:MAG TPA: anti-sigma F factor [Pseudogracilibacillus sp.]|nr:anti-sigma F factor [Pseudogracilibacillus sp.]